MEFLKTTYTLFSVLGYPISLIELVGTLSFLVAVFLAAKNIVNSWIFAIINVVSFFFIFYEKHLYAESILQIYFLFNCIYGIFYWKDQNHKIRNINDKESRYYKLFIIFGILISYLTLSLIKSAQYPLLDSIITIVNIIGTIMLSRRIIETWFVWIFLNIISAILYFKIGLTLIALEYIVFIFINFYALKQWKRLMKLENT